MTPPDIAKYVDFTLLRSDATEREIDDLCAAASAAGFVAVCVNGIWVERACAALRGTGVLVATVVGFPLGADPWAVKVSEARDLVGRGADEIDMVVSLGHLLDGDVDYVTMEIQKVVAAAAGRPVKAILETAALTTGQIANGVTAARDGGARFVKTSTGMHPKGGATVAAVALLADLAGSQMGVKASGGIRSLADAQRLIAAGANRIGTSTNLMSSNA